VNIIVKVQNVNLILLAWGEVYIDRMMSRALSSVLAPGNLPKLSEKYHCFLTILTQSDFFDYVKNHPTYSLLTNISELRLISIDELITEPWQYGMTISKAFTKGILKSELDILNTYFLFLNSDFMISNNSFSSLIESLENGNNLIYAPSYCVNEEDVIDEINTIKSRNSNIFNIDSTNLSKLILKNLHLTVISKIINNEFGIQFKYPDQFYYKHSDDIVLGYQMPIALVGMRPEVIIKEASNFWDWGLLYEFCPSKKIYVLGNSCDFTMLELREKYLHIENLELRNNSNTEKIRNNISIYLTQYQIDFAKFRLILHSLPLQINLDNEWAILDNFKNNILSKLNIDKVILSNSQWEYHSDFFNFYRKNEIASLRNKIKKEIEHIEKFSNYFKLSEINKLSEIKASNTHNLSVLNKKIAYLTYKYSPNLFKKLLYYINKCYSDNFKFGLSLFNLTLIKNSDLRILLNDTNINDNLLIITNKVNLVNEDLYNIHFSNFSSNSLENLKILNFSKYSNYIFYIDFRLDSFNNFKDLILTFKEFSNLNVKKNIYLIINSNSKLNYGTVDNISAQLKFLLPNYSFTIDSFKINLFISWYINFFDYLKNKSNVIFLFILAAFSPLNFILNYFNWISIKRFNLNVNLKSIHSITFKIEQSDSSPKHDLE